MQQFGKIEWQQRHLNADCRFWMKRRSWSWFSAEHVHVMPTELEFRVKGDAAYLALHDSIRFDGETIINGGRRSSTIKDLRHKLTFVPKGSSVEGWNSFKGRRVSSVFAVHLASGISQHDANDISDVPPSLYFESDNLRATLQKLQAVLDGSGIDDAAYAETLGLLLLWELRLAGAPRQSGANSARGGLTARQLGRVREFIDAEITNEIAISDLATVAGLSQFHFIRAFKDSVGQSPYQYVLSERIRRAKELLPNHDFSLSDVAFATGFSGPSQLNRVFRKFVGVTPAAFRRGD